MDNSYVVFLSDGVIFFGGGGVRHGLSKKKVQKKVVSDFWEESF